MSAPTPNRMLPFEVSQDRPIAQFEIGSMRNFVYLILDWKSRKAAIVDPQRDLSRPLGVLKEHGFELTHVLLTHTHHDHVAGVPELLRTHPNAKITLHENDEYGKTLPASAATEFLKDRQVVQVGGLAVQALRTPGHTAWELTYWIDGKPGYLLTGDTVFIRDCGRTDFPDGSNEQMFESLQKIKTFAPDTVILPGHHYAPECHSTVERERAESPPFLCRSVEELMRLP